MKLLILNEIKKGGKMKKNKKMNFKIYKNIKSMMENKKINQQEIAEKLNVQASTVCRTFQSLKNGKSVLTETIFKIADALEIEPTELFK